MQVSNFAPTLRRFGMPVALAAMIVSGACGQTDNTATDQPDSSYAEEVAEKPETLEQAATNPEEYLGEVVTVVGEVVAVYGNQAFAIQEEEYFAQDQNMLVVAADSAATMPEVGEYVELTGEVQRFSVTDLDKDYDITLDGAIIEEVEVTYADAPYILATSINDPGTNAAN